MEANVIVGIGEVLWDVLPEGKKIGGAPANFAYHVSQFGFDGMVVSAVGHDQLGAELLSQLDGKDMRYIIPKVDYATGTVTVELDGQGIPTYEIKENVAWDNIPLTTELLELAKKTQAVSFGSLAQRNAVSRATIHSFLDAMPVTPDTFKVFDINLRQHFYTPQTIEESLERCNVLKINDEELVIISRLFGYPGIDLRDKCRSILEKYNLEMLILTCGINGSYVFSPGNVSFIGTPDVKVADTVGAGDSFTASFIAGLLSGLPIGDAHRLAVETSAYVCTCHGAMPGLPSSLTDKCRCI